MREKLSNFWYYYKIHVVIALFLIALTAYSVVEIKDRVRTDLDIVIGGTDVLTIDSMNQFTSEIQALIKDANKDDKVICTVNNVVVDEENSNFSVNSVYYQKLTLTVATGESKLYIVNEELLTFLKNKNVCEKITSTYDKLNIPYEGEQYFYKIKHKNPILQSLKLKDKEYYVFIRIRNSVIKNNVEQDIQYQNAYRILEEIINNDR